MGNILLSNMVVKIVVLVSTKLIWL